MRLATRVLAAAVLAAAISAGGATPSFAGGIELVSSERKGERLEELTLRTPAVGGPTGVRVLLPAGYESQPRRRYPVLYLLHGAADGFRSWTDKGDAEAISAGQELIVVMPDSGTSGGYVNWYNGGAFGPPAWETYHVEELIPFVDGRYRTIARRAGRAVAGLSMGGGGAYHYAARHPDLFVHAAGFSPAVDLSHPALIVLNELESAAYGPYLTHEVRRRGHNPVDLAENLRGLTLSLRTGNGLPGGRYGGGDPVEGGVYQMSVALHRRLDELGIAHLWDDYGPGGHTWPYWQRDLRLELPLILNSFRNPAPRPRAFAYRSIDQSYSVYGWRVTLERPVVEFSRLEAGGRRGFTLEGSGRARVRTPGLYRAGRRYRVTVDWHAGKDSFLTRAGRRGRISLLVPLGPPNQHQQYTLESRLAGTSTYRSSVSVNRAR